MKSKEETIALRVFDLLSDIRLDPNMIGFYLAHSGDPNIYDTLSKVIEATTLTRAQRADRIKTMILGDDVTDFDTKCQILADFWEEYSGDENFQAFLDYNDVGLPLAHMIVNNIVEPTDKGTEKVNETFDLLLELFGVEDTGFATLTELVK